jgi:predicted nucleotidyltransferase
MNNPLTTSSHQRQWRQRYHLQSIGLYSCGEACGYGSTARNEAKAGSDVDVWVELHPLTPFAMVNLKQELETLLQRPVDLVRLRERMNPALRQAILREGVSACCTRATSAQPGETAQVSVVSVALVP